MVAIILPVCDSMPHLPPMLKALYESTNVPFKLIIIESESTDGTAEFCDEFEVNQRNVKVLHTKKEGLTKAINTGIKEAGEDDVYITQDDVIHFRLYGRDWLLDMMDKSQDKGVAMVTCPGGTGISGKDYVEGLRWVGTWCIYLPRRIINDIGLYDENMSPGDDIDYSYRCMKKGYKIGLIDYWVQHHRLTDHEDADSKIKQKRMSEYFKNKYGL